MSRSFLPPGSDGSRRGSERASLSLLCDVKLGTGAWQKIRLLDLSRDGFRIGWLPAGQVGDKLWLRLPGLEPLSAQLAWRDGSAVGCRFSAPLSIYVFDHLVAQAKAQES